MPASAATPAPRHRTIRKNPDTPKNPDTSTHPIHFSFGAITVTSESHFPAGTDDRTLAPPPGCPPTASVPAGCTGCTAPRRTTWETCTRNSVRSTVRSPRPAPQRRADLGGARPRREPAPGEHPTHFSRDSRLWKAVQDGTAGPDHPLAPHIAWQPICSHAEGDEHLRLRGAVIGAMSTINHRTIRRHINRATQLLVNRFCEKGRADLVSQFAEHLPMAVLCEILGMPDEYDDRLVQATRDLLRAPRPRSPATSTS